MITPMQELPNGAIVIASKDTSRPGASQDQHIVLAMWSKGPSGVEYITWNVDPESLDCQWGHYHAEFADAVKDFVTRGN